MANDINTGNNSLTGASRQLDRKGTAVDANNQSSSGKENTSAATPRNTGDTVNLSSQAQDIAKIQRALAQLPEIDQAKVSEIRDQIANGSYTVDVEALAEKILADDAFFDS